LKFLKDNTVVDIMEATKDDAKEMLEYLKKIGSETTYLLFDENGISNTLEQEEEYLESANKKQTTKMFVAKVDGLIVGSCNIKGHEKEKTKHNVDLGISVLKEFWNKGLGRLLLEHTINYARITQVIKNIYLEVREDNLDAIRLYEKLGFKFIAKMPDKIFCEGKYFAENVYLLQI